MRSETDGEGGQKAAVVLSEWLAAFWPALLVGSLALAGAVALGGFIRDREARALEVAETRAQVAVLTEIETHLIDQVGALERLAANWERRGGLPRAEFEAEAGDLARASSLVQAIEWADPSFYVRWVVPMAGNEKAQGLAMAFEVRRRTALEVSRDGHMTTLSRPIQLVQGGLGFIVNVPLEVDGRFEGFVLGVFKADDLLSRLLWHVAPGFAVRITDDGEFLYARDVSDAVWPRVRVVRMQDSPRPWSIEVAPLPEVVATYQTQMPLLLVGAGAALAMGLAFTTHLAGSRRIRNRQLAAEVKRREGVEQEMSRVIEAHPDHVWSGEVTSEGYETLYYSPAIAPITGYPIGTFEGSPEAWYERVHEEDVETLKRLHTELATGNRDSFELEYRIWRADGALRWIRDRVQLESTEHRTRIDGVLSDITESKHAEMERLSSQHEMLLLLERERITREMHDGLGGQLVSTIAMLERGRSSPSEVIEALRRALDDMRIMIDSVDPASTDLATSLGKLRGRLEPLLRRNGIVLRWQVEDQLDLDEFPPELSLHLLRIIQEAVTNVILHAKASELSVHIRAGDAVADVRDAVLFIEIQDDGRGFRPDAAGGGRGIRNMKSRAEALGAELRFDSGDSGTRVELRVPIPR
jgi:PAS domain S-box-containing protein